MTKRIDRKQIPDHPLYFADRKGRIWRKFFGRWRVINPVIHHDGFQYTYTGSSAKKKLTQRLVCAAFKGLCCEELPLCIRKARGQQPRRLRSQRYLDWGSYGDKRPGASYHHLTLKEQTMIIKLHRNGTTQIFLARQFGVSQPTISYLVNGKTKLRKHVP